MELYQLRTFLAVVQEGHLGRAAERLFVSLPAVSSHVRALEDELGLELFTRTPRGMVPTEAGHRLVAKARAVLDAAGQVKDMAREMRDVPAGTVRIGLNTDAAFSRVTGIISYLRERYPRLEPFIAQSLSLVIQEAVADGEMDGGYSYGGLFAPEVCGIKVAEVELCVVAPTKMSRDLPAMSWGDLAAQPWIWIPTECPFHSLLEAEFACRKLTPRKELIADSEITIRTLLAAGLGLTIMRLDEGETEEAAGNGVIWHGGRMSIPLHFVYARARERDRNVRALLEAVRSVWSLNS